MAKAAASGAKSNGGGKVKAPSKSEVLNNLSTATGLSRKEISAVLDALTADIGKAVGKKGVGMYQIPGLCKIVRKQNPPKPAREGINPATGEKIMIKAKPASTTVKVRPLKNLKEMVK
jgi:nucleoid DNA-binding protein